MSVPPDIPHLAEWFATPQDALNADACFVTYMSTQYSTQKVLTGTPISGRPREALIQGLEYHWQRAKTRTSPAFMWRTEVDNHSLEGASGPVLCLGRVSDPICVPLCFQNYESLFRGNTFYKFDPQKNDIGGFSLRASYDCGFFLPPDVQRAKIIMGSQRQERRRSVSGQTPGTTAREREEKTAVSN
jgi:hypothetical protein